MIFLIFVQNYFQLKNYSKTYKITIEENKKIVLESGGLYVIGTERHESRRIDNQLRGRSGRQGDVGSSQFFVSFEDDTLDAVSCFGVDRMSNVAILAVLSFSARHSNK